MAKPKISVIMGIFNCEATLNEAIESILAQTFKDWKMIMCDDASQDNSYAVAKSYVEQYPDKFVLIKNEVNMGLNFTLNRCLELADTPYIARMDGDDISLPKRFEKQVEFLDEHPEYAIVSAQMEFFDAQGGFGVSKMEQKPDEKTFLKGTPFCHAPCMVRSQAYKSVGGYSVSKSLLRVEDYHLWLKMYVQGYKGYNLPQVLYRMRDDRNAIKRRKLKFRLNEAYVKYIAIRSFKLSVYNIVYCAVPILKGLLPTGIYKILHRKKHKIKD